jgi:hypothetical protein
VIDRLRQWLQRFFAVFRHTRIDRDHEAEVAERLQMQSTKIAGCECLPPKPAARR